MSEDRDFRSWQITVEQADKISQGDIVEMSAFYTNHIDRLRGMAYVYARTHNVDSNCYRYDPEEMLSQLYLDLPYLNWQNALSLTMSIKQTSFAWSAYGGYAQRVAQGLPHSHKFAPWELCLDVISGDCHAIDEDDGETILGFVSAPEEERPDNILINLERSDLTASEICRMLAPVLTERSTSILELYLEGYSLSQIGEKLGLQNNGILYQVIPSLVLRYRDIMKYLYSDREIPSFIKNVVPPTYEQLAERSDERNARRRARQRAKREAETGKPSRKSPRRFSSEEERLEAKRERSRIWAQQKREKLRQEALAQNIVQGGSQ